MTDPPRHFLLLGCSERKRPDAELLPAIERYDGPAFRVLRKAIREHAELAAQLDIWIVSARFGLIWSQQPIPDYDEPMTAARAQALADETHTELTRLLSAPARVDARCFISLGARYWQAIGGLLVIEGQHVTIASGGIGERAAQLKRWLLAITERTP